jgi:hypothetical protein
MNKQITEPKHSTGNTVHGKHYGVFAITGMRWSETVGEWIYGVIQLDQNGNKASREMNMVESCFA